MSRMLDLTGKRVGKLLVVSYAGKNNGGRNVWNCRCDCGNEAVVPATALSTERTNSCGCYQKFRASETFKKHGMHGTRLYKIWSNMIQRCSNPKNDNYHLYGAKGVSVCEEWKDFATFSKWAMDSGYADNLSIDRIETDEGYCPDNCRWATPLEQTENRKCTRYVSFNGKTQTLKRWSEETGVAYKKLLWRIDHGWPVEKALTK